MTAKKKEREKPRSCPRSEAQRFHFKDDFLDGVVIAMLLPMVHLNERTAWTPIASEASKNTNPRTGHTLLITGMVVP